MVRKHLLVGIVVAGWVVGMARAAVIVSVSQRLHCEAYTGDGVHRIVDAPADVVLGAVYGARTVSARSEQQGYLGEEGYLGWPWASVSLTTHVQEKSISATGTTGLRNLSGVGIKAMATSDIVFDVGTPSVFEINFKGWNFTNSTVSIKTADNALVWSDFGKGYAERNWLTLGAGRYELQVSLEGLTMGGGVGAVGDTNFSMVAVPEAGAVGAMVMMGVGLLGVRRRR